MASMADRIKGFLSRPKGRMQKRRGRRKAAMSRTQQKFKQMTARIRGRSAPRR
jgi:hypothetical protein